MKKQFTKLIQNLCAVLVIAFLSLVTTNVMGQDQIIGSFPNTQGGFENQTAGGYVASALSATAWTAKGGGSSVWSIVNSSSARTGGKFATFPTGIGTGKYMACPTALSLAASTAYTIQFYYKTPDATTTAASYLFATIPTNATSAPTTGAISLAGTSGTWTKNTVAYTSTSTAPNSTGYITMRCMAITTKDVNFDDFVLYAGSVDNIAPDPATSQSASTAVATQMSVSWSAPGTGVDGGGYMVVRGLTDPTTTPNANGIYGVGLNAATGEQVVYLGTTPSFTDMGLTPLTHYYYRIYTVDKAFNYSSAVSADASTTAPSYAAEPTIQSSNLSFTSVTSTGFTINWTAGDGANNLVVIRSGSAVNADPADGNTYAANTVFGSGAAIGTGNYVVYSGTGTSVSVTGLTKATTYYVNVYSFNGSAGSENYLITSPTTANQMTLPAEISSSGINSAGVNWSVTTAWVGGVVPGAGDNVTIVAGDKINVAASASCYNLTVQSTGKLYNNTALPTSSLTYLTVYGTSITCDGTLGDKTVTDITKDGALGINFVGNLTINGSGTIRPARLRPNATTQNATLTINADMEMTYPGSTGAGGSGIYTDNSGNDNITITVNSGKTLSFVDYSNLSMTSGATNGTASTIFNINGSINMPGTNSTFLIPVTTGKTSTLNVNGALNVTNFNGFSYSGGAIPTITVGGSGTITVGKLADFSSPTLSAAITGTGTFTLSSGATINLAAASGLEPVAGPIRTTTRNFNSGANYTYSGTAAQVTGSDLPATVNNLTVSNTAGVTLSAATVISGTLTVNAGTTLKNGGYTLTNSGTANINGSFQIDEGGWATGNNFVYGAAGTLVFNNSTGPYGVSGTPAYWPASSGPVNVTVQNTGGLNLQVARTISGVIQTSAGITSAGNLTVNGTLQLNGGGGLDAAPTYGVSSTLIYNTGGTYGRYKEWDTTTPANLQLSNNTTLNYPNGAIVARTLTGNLTINAGSSLYMDYGSIGMNQPLTVNGNVTLNGNLSLGDAVGGDIYVGGNWTTGSGSNLYPNSRAVLFNGTAEQTITNAGGVSFPYMIIQPGSKVTLAASNLLTATNLTINSSASGTGTFVNNGTLTNTNANVNQVLTGNSGTSTRGWWYISSPVSNATAAVFNVAGGTNKLWYYDEVNGSAGPAYKAITDNGTALNAGTGYVASIGGADATYTFTGTLNNGDITINPSRTGTTAGKRGFNLVGNPYPSYLDWNSTDLVKTNLRSTIWYRTLASGSLTGTMTFDTFDGTIGTGNGQNGTVTRYIPPMQTFWVKVDLDGETGTLTFKNTARSHQDQSVAGNRLRVPARTNLEAQLVRLKVSNGINSDEAILVGDANASDAYDSYDSEKMTNNDASIPEIFTLAGTEELVINHLNNLSPDKEVTLGFRPGQTGPFSINVTEITNLAADTKIMLLDKLTGTQQELTVGTPYNFTTANATATNDRFSILFKSASAITGINPAGNTKDITVYRNPNNRITVISNSGNNDQSVSVYNAVGQKLITQKLTGTTTEVGNTFTPGVYLVSVNNGLNSLIRRVIIK